LSPVFTACDARSNKSFNPYHKFPLCGIVHNVLFWIIKLVESGEVVG